MASPREKLAASLQTLRELQESGAVAIRSSDLTRTHRERLLENGFLREVIKGWYVPTRPGEQRGESTGWYASFWGFCADYLNARFGTSWCLSPEQSLLLHAGNWAVPKQLLVRSPRGDNKPVELPHETSLLSVRSALPEEGRIEVADKVRLFCVADALVASGPAIFAASPTEVRAALGGVRDGSDILGLLLDGGHSVVAGRLAGAFRNIGRDRIAGTILETMRAAGFRVSETDPFEGRPARSLTGHDPSAHVRRLRLMWESMRGVVLERFPPSPGVPVGIEGYMRAVEEAYASDAYHSLSIEGYEVSPELIEGVRSGDWDPDHHPGDGEMRDAMAARGYYDAFQSVKESVRRVLVGENPGEVVARDHEVWYRKLFAPSVTAGIVRPADLGGYRNGPVMIRESRHVPPRKEAARDLMPAFFQLLREEPEPAARSVLGHFVFVYIHPYFDGNGRMARFLMNVMLASGGYPWTVFPVEQRDRYLTALEQASVEQDIAPFADLTASLIP